MRGCDPGPAISRPVILRRTPRETTRGHTARPDARRKRGETRRDALNERRPSGDRRARKSQGSSPTPPGMRVRTGVPSPLRFASLAVACLGEDLHLQASAHAGRTTKEAPSISTGPLRSSDSANRAVTSDDRRRHRRRHHGRRHRRRRRRDDPGLRSR